MVYVDGCKVNSAGIANKIVTDSTRYKIRKVATSNCYKKSRATGVYKV